MKEESKFKTTSLSDFITETYGETGTPERDKFEAEVAEEIKQERLKQSACTCTHHKECNNDCQQK